MNRATVTDKVENTYYNPIKAKMAASYISNMLMSKSVLVTSVSGLQEYFRWKELPKKFKSRLAELRIQMIVDAEGQAVLYREDCSMSGLPLLSHL